jgi:hypothetical protein
VTAHTHSLAKQVSKRGQGRGKRKASLSWLFARKQGYASRPNTRDSTAKCRRESQSRRGKNESCAYDSEHTAREQKLCLRRAARAASC